MLNGVYVFDLGLQGEGKVNRYYGSNHNGKYVANKNKPPKERSHKNTSNKQKGQYLRHKPISLE